LLYNLKVMNSFGMRATRMPGDIPAVPVSSTSRSIRKFLEPPSCLQFILHFLLKAFTGLIYTHTKFRDSFDILG
jgi:hypothetical protein